jgi:hypothetical protein
MEFRTDFVEKDQRSSPSSDPRRTGKHSITENFFHMKKLVHGIRRLLRTKLEKLRWNRDRRYLLQFEPDSVLADLGLTREHLKNGYALRTERLHSVGPKQSAEILRFPAVTGNAAIPGSKTHGRYPKSSKTGRISFRKIG